MRKPRSGSGEALSARVERKAAVRVIMVDEAAHVLGEVINMSESMGLKMFKWNCCGFVGWKQAVQLIPLPLCFAIAYVLGVEIAAGKVIGLSTIFRWKTVLIAAIAYVVNCLLAKSVAWCARRSVKGREQSRITTAHDRLFCSRYSFFILWGVIMAVWLPVYLAAFPGTYALDTVYQTRWLITGEQITVANPVLHTLWLSLPMMASKAWFGSYVPGVAFHTFTQMMALSAIFAGILTKLNRVMQGNRVVAVLSWMSLLFFCCYPGNVIYAVVITKDVVFAGLFALCLLTTYEASLDPDLYFSSKRNCGRFFVLFFVTCMFRNNFVYGLLLFVLVALIILRKSWLKATALMTIAAASCLLVNGPIASALGVGGVKSVDFMSVPAAQLSLVATEDHSDLSPEELSFIDEVVPEWEKYNPTIADFVKARFNLDFVSSDPISFVRNYAVIGCEHPDLYATAFLRLNIGYWFPSQNWVAADYASTDEFLRLMSPWYWYMKTPDAVDSNMIGIDREPLLPGLCATIADLSNNRYEIGVPILPTLLSAGALFWLVLFVLQVSLMNEEKNKMLATIFFLAYWATLFLAPVSMYRYAYPIFTCLPIFLFLILCSPKTAATADGKDREHCLATKAKDGLYDLSKGDDEVCMCRKCD